MTTPVKRRFSALVAVVVAGYMGATIAVASASPVMSAPVCTFTIDDPIPIGPDPVTATMRFTEAVGDSLTAAFPAESHVELVSLKRTRADNALTAQLTVTTRQAVAGQYDVMVTGNHGQCGGKVWIGQGAKQKSATAAGPAPAQSPNGPPTLSASASPSKGSCAVFSDDSIPAGQTRAEVLAHFTEPLGDRYTASFPPEARIEVISAKHQDGDEPRSIRLVMNTATAVTGKWKLTLAGDMETCTGMLYVGKRK
ncbi:MAG TPA: hypothetical protein VE967_11230 [Gemmatimonadaceae bacterium]|nr:hypothetical protein [Gemmatimonadaceae bacterium]